MYSAKTKQEQFRTDINMLRALAVVAVVLYHFGVPGFSGGFSGVDIFFVISGYLMTGIVVRAMDDGSFSLWDFYVARARRIVPALIAVCVVLLIVGWYLLAPDDYSQMSSHIKSSLLFISNEAYRKEFGYFDQVAEEKWLLHTWSLSVEWQFYLILPLIFLAIKKIFKTNKAIFLFLVIGFVVSYISAALRTGVSQEKAFYLLKYRCWELFAGGIVYFAGDVLSKEKLLWSRCIFVAGMVLVIWAMFASFSVSLWPGWAALIPVAGTSLVILAGKNDFVVNRMLVVKWLGDRSYSIYLWHWPIVVLLGYMDLSNAWLWVAVGIITSLLMAEISYRFVELPTRARKSRKHLMLILAALVLICLAAEVVVKKKGFVSRVSADVMNIRSEKYNGNKRGPECVADNRDVPPVCKYGGENIKAIVVGDSHANSIVSAVAEAASRKYIDGGVLYMGHLACPLIDGIESNKSCADFNQWLVNTLRNEYLNIPVILVTRMTYYAMGGNEGRHEGSGRPRVHFGVKYNAVTEDFLEEFSYRTERVLCEISENRNVYVMRPIPEMGVDVPVVMAREKMRGRDIRVIVSLDDYKKRHRFSNELLDKISMECNVSPLDPAPLLCDSDVGCVGDRGGRPLYFDDDHLSEFGNRLLVPMFMEIL